MLLVPAGGVCASHEALSSRANPDLRCDRCNVVFLNLDFLRADYVGLLGDSTSTPNIDDYFKNSIVFENVLSPAGSSYRGNLSVLTGTAPHIYELDVDGYESLKRHKELGQWRRVYTSHETIGQVLAKSGYHTTYLNKGRRSGARTLLDRGFDRYIQFPLQTLFEDLLPSLRSNLETAEQPFFLLFHAIPTRLHTPYYPLNRPRIRGDHIVYKKYKMKGRYYGYRVVRNNNVPVARQAVAEHQIYNQQLIYADEHLQGIFDLLKRFEDDTIIVLYSNHGTQLGDKGIFASNGVSYQSCIHVPLMIKHPKIVNPVRITTPVSLVDLVATIYDMLMIDAPGGMTGNSLIPVISGERYQRTRILGKNDPDEYIREGKWKMLVRYRQQHELYDLTKDPEQRENVILWNRMKAKRMEYINNYETPWKNLIVEDNWKLVLDRAKKIELYDIHEDPNETNDLSRQYPQVVKRLEDALEQAKRESVRKRLSLFQDNL
jgi:arylsulfatase A-like enzyme